MAETQTEKPDLTEVPKFDALRKWIDKLDGWCHAAVEEADRVKTTLEEKVENLENDLADAQSEARDTEELREWIEDVERGILTFPELLQKVREW
jgi:uncharacterized protein YgfB (UPF0149 family)